MSQSGIWTDDQFASVRDYQDAGRWHPYTCGGGGGPCSGVSLEIRPDGMHCPSCERVQTWVHDFVLDGSWREMLGLTSSPGGEPNG